MALVLLAGAVLTVVFLTRDDSPAGAAPPETSELASPHVSDQPAPASTPPAKPATGDPSVCGLEGVVMDADRLLTSPDIEWVYEETVQYPVSAGAGPGETAPNPDLDDRTLGWCYARTPEGAVLSAAHTAALIQISAVDAALEPATIEWFQAHTIDEIPEEHSAMWNPVNPPESEKQEAMQIRPVVAGFQLLEYDGTTALVDILMSYQKSGMGSDYVSMRGYFRWSSGDWRLVMTDQERLGYNLAGLGNAAPGYVMFN